MTSMITNAHIDRLIDLAYDEDLGPSGDITTQATVLPETRAEGAVKAKEPLVLCGVDVFRRVFERLDPSVELDVLAKDGDEIANGTFVIKARGRAHSLLIGERPALNFLMRLSGIATQARAWSKVLAGTSTRVIDTRKTTPGWRALEKHAVKVGGGGNHRMGLFDGVLIKDNHIEAAGGISAAVTRARATGHHLTKIEVEAGTLAHVDECLAIGADAILLDNMDDALLTQAVQKIRAHETLTGRKVTIEASGNMTVERLPRVAATGVDLVSMGALTHQAKSVDLSMKLKLLK
jgi:nicotinate-nucleotide pyrophosphorylase (carboxylating)